MKYFTWDFMYGIEQKNEAEQKEHYEEFRLRVAKHEQDFSNVKKAFSKESLHNYEVSGRFHDYVITDLNIFNNDKSNIYPRLEVLMKLSGNGEYTIHYKGVSNFAIINEMDTAHSRAVSRWSGFDLFLYTEFDALSNNYYKQEILLLTGAVLKIEFKRIIIKKIP